MVTVDYWNVPKVIKPGQQVTSTVGYTISGPGAPGAITYKSVLGEWQPCTPLATIENGITQGPGSYRREFDFVAPTNSGMYRMRFAMTWAYQGITNFFGNGPAGDAWNPGVGDYAEVVIRVENPPVVDHFLSAINTDAINCYDPNGGWHPRLTEDSTVRMNYWNIPEVLEAGRPFHCSLGYSITGPGEPGAITYKTVLADWQPLTPLATLEDGITQGPGDYRRELDLVAPTTPGTYRLRFAMGWAYRATTKFYGDGPPWDAWNPGVCDYAEVTVKVAIVDADADGLPDWWEYKRFGDLSPVAADDPDGDGYANAEEFANGTSPTAFDIGPMSIWTAAEVGWRTVTGRNYQVQYRTNITGNWMDLGAPVAGTGSFMTILDSTRAAGQKFYRVILAP